MASLPSGHLVRVGKMHRTPGGCPDPTWMSQFTLGEAAQPKVKRTHSEASPPGLNPDFSTYWLCSLRSFKSVLCMSVSFPVHARMQTCLILCDPIDCSPPGSSVHGDSPGKNTGVGCHALLQRNFLTHILNPGLLHYRQIFYHLSYQGNPSSPVRRGN